MAFLRVKYRPKAIQPELTNAQENVAFSLAKKEKPIEEDPYGEIKKVTTEEPVFLPSQTQKRRVEVIVESDEVGYRQKVYPTIYERIERQRDWVFEQIQEEKMAAKREALIRKTDRAMQQMKNSMDNPDGSVPMSSEGSLVDYDESLEKDLDLLDADEEKGGEDEMPSEEPKNMKETQKQLKEQFLLIKEKKIVFMRNSHLFHNGLTLAEQRRIYFKILMGWTIRKENSKNTTYVLDWLILGRKEVALNLQMLLKMNVTHILNMTNDVKNAYPKHFMYEKIAIRDSDEEDVAKYFTKIVGFIKRCEDCKGRIFVHCLAGSSRAPTAVLAYLIVEKKIPLIDAYNYLLTIRSFVRPNNRFLFQLAMLEVSLGEGCSVYFHKDWRFYEFNLFRAEGVPARESLGMYKTIRKLYEKKEIEIV